MMAIDETCAADWIADVIQKENPRFWEHMRREHFVYSIAEAMRTLELCIAIDDRNPLAEDLELRTPDITH